VLYEMAGGKRAFGGKSVLDTLHAIARTEPQPIAEIKPDTPADLERILKKCLAKDVAERYQHAGDLLVDLRSLAKEVDAGTARPLGEIEAPVATPEEPPRRSLVVPLGAAAIVALLVNAVAWFALWPDTPAPGNTMRFDVEMPAGMRISGSPNPLAFSPDGSTIVQGLSPLLGGERTLWVRRLDQTDLEPLRDTETATFPFFSPDGEWVGFLVDGSLRKASLTGGPSLPIAEPAFGVAGFGPASWGEDGIIVTTIREGEGLYGIPASGGEPVLLLASEAIEGPVSSVFSPRHIRGHNAVLFTIDRGGSYAVGALSLNTLEPQILIEPGADARYMASGHLLYNVGGTLFVAPFDADSLEAGSGSAFQEDVRTWGPWAHAAISSDGTLAYFDAGGGAGNGTLVWRTFDGATEAVSTSLREGFFHAPKISPDGKRVVYGILSEEGFSTMIQDLETHIEQEFMPDAGFPVWSPDGETIYYSLPTDGNWDIYRRNADLSGDSERIVEGPSAQISRVISPDGEWLIYADTRIWGTGSNTFWIQSLGEGGEPRRLLEGDANEMSIAFSPDGRWLAWSSNRSGSPEVYVSSFPNLRGERQVSRGGGKDVAWSPDGATLYFARNDGQLFGVAFRSVDDFAAQAPVMSGVNPLMNGGNFAIADGGDRLLMFEAPSEEAQAGMVRMKVVVNWFAEIIDRLGGGR